ncbi:MAG: MGMT family protein [Candidatus Aenigmatarchaeota archaeon]
MNANKTFSEKVLEMVRKIPKGRVTTYSEIARALGNPRACRAVGNALKRNSSPDTIPCYRVVRRDGSIGEYSRGKREKLRLLKKDGIEIIKRKINMNKHFHSFENQR